MDLSKIKPEFRKEIVRGGEAYLDGQLRVATSADSRAAGLAGMFTAAATALTAGVIALLNASWPLISRFPLMAAGATAALLFLFGALLCIRAIQPVDFWLPGCEPENWTDDVTKGHDLDDCLGERAQHIQEKIDANAQVIASNARRFRWGSRLGIGAPFAGVVIWVLASLYIYWLMRS